MKIVEAIKIATLSGRPDDWASLLPQYLGHRLHVAYRQRTDGWDARHFEHIARSGTAYRAGLTHVERRDGTSQPMLMAHTLDCRREQISFSGPERRKAA